MAKSNLDKAIRNTAYILDNLELLRHIQKTGDCNTCKAQKSCKYAPEVGQMVRYNCPFYNGRQWPYKVGRWVEINGCFECSECGADPYYSYSIHDYKYCPYCGAKMEVEE